MGDDAGDGAETRDPPRGRRLALPPGGAGFMLLAVRDILARMGWRRSMRVMVGGLVLAGWLTTGWAAEAPVVKADHVLVEKSGHRLSLYRKGELLARFPVVFGFEPTGHKQQEGDGRTPEGRYVLDYKNPRSQYYKSIHISYPNRQDIERARQRGVSPGGAIMIHGQPRGYEWAQAVTQLRNWTWGCIALRNEDMEAVWRAVDPGTPIEIKS